MSAGAQTTATYDAILKDIYSDEFFETLNKETKLFSQFKKGVFKFEGRRIVFPIHTGRNTSVGAFAPGGATNQAGKQDYVDGFLDVKSVGGKLQVDRDLVKRAPGKGAGAFAAAMTSEMERLREDMIFKEDQYAVAGGTIKGYTNEHKATNASGGAFVGGGAANDGADVTFEYSGDFTPFLSVVAATTNTWVRIRAWRMDTYAEILAAGGAGTNAIFVKDFSVANGTLTIASVAGGAGAIWTTVPTGAGFAIAIGLHATQLQDGLAVNFGTVNAAFVLEPSGVFDYLGLPTYLTIDRTTATGTVLLQATCKTQATAGGHARAAPTAVRMQSIQDDIFLLGGKNADAIWINPKMRQQYIALTTAVTQLQVARTGGASDPSVDDSMLHFGGLKLTTAQHIPRGMFIYLTLDTWATAELDKMHFADEGGGIIQRVPGFDSLEAEVLHRYNHICKRPNCNGLLTGVTY